VANAKDVSPPAGSFARPVVGVVIPMYNASQTIDGTLASVCAQTYRNLDIVVVDDGSTDDSAAKVKAWVSHEPRLRLISRTNTGVAAARNHGAQHVKADFLAFVDSDDLWAPQKVEAQMSCLAKSPDTVGLIYSWYAHLDETDRVLSLSHRPAVEGWVLREMLRSNAVGNGSSALIRRQAFEQAGGFDPDPGHDGCEDLAICLRIAELYEYRVVKRHLVGYRILAHNKSGNAEKMVRACSRVLNDYRLRYPQYGSQIDEQLDGMRFWLLIRTLAAGNYRSGYAMLSQLWSSNPTFLVRCLPLLAATLSRAKAPRRLKMLARPLLEQSTGLGVRYLERQW